MNVMCTKIAVASTVACILAWTGSYSVMARRLVNTPATARAKNLVNEGDIDGAMTQARALIADLRAHDWDWDAIDTSLLHLPDQQYAEWEAQRGTWQYSFYHCKHPIYDEVAFYCDLYARLNLHIVPGIEGENHPTGFFIVGWKDGRVTQVPVAEARLFDIGAQRSKLVFPGMGEYSATLPVWGH